MLHLIFGRAGSGKTWEVREKLSRLASSGESPRLFLLVPEQYSFESERAMLHLLGPKMAQSVQVMSFTRLGDALFRDYGGLSGKKLDDGGRNILMSLTLQEIEEQLPFYQRSAQTSELVRMMLETQSELKMCSITSEALGHTADKMEDSTLREKVKELALIFSAYDAMVAQSYLDPLDDLTRIKETLRFHRYFDGASVMMDSFKSFTAQELGVIEEILRQAKDVSLTLCMDSLSDTEHEMGLFAPVQQTAGQMIRLAQKNSVPVAVPERLSGAPRFRGDGLRHLEEGAFRLEKTPWEAPAEDVTLFSASDLYEESAFTASEIRRLVMEQGYRYRDFAIILRSPENYLGNLDVALERWEIPYFMDRPRSIDAEPLIRMVLGAFQIVHSGFASDDVFVYLKTGLTQLSPEDISALENYVFLWKISGKKWKETWTDNPAGFTEQFTEEQTEELQKINETRSLVLEPLLTFSRAVKEANGEKIALAVYQLLVSVGVPEAVRALSARLKECGQLELAEQQPRLWDMMMEILDQMALVLKESPIAPEKFSELLRLVIQSKDISSIPQGLDEVAVGSADRMRPAEPKVVFLLGAVQGEFPLMPGTGGVFSDEERKILIGLGMPLTGTAEQTAVEERFLAYSAMTSASERLYITYPSSGSDGEARTPSSIVSETMAALPGAKHLAEIAPEQYANAERPAFELTARRWRESSALSVSLRELFLRRSQYASKLLMLERSAQKLPAVFEDTKKALNLFGEAQKLSATQIETYYLCRFQYFCRYGLSAKERKPAELDAIQYGSLIHYLLEKLLREYGSKKLAAMNDDELKTEILKSIREYAEIKLGGLENKTPRFTFLFHRMAESARVIIRRIAEELSQSKFEPVAFELELKAGGKYPPLMIRRPDGGIVTVEGKIDRLDAMELNGETYLRVVDYKTGKKEFRLSDVLCGLNMQMLIYLAAVIETSGAKPAGVLYMPAMRPALSAEKGQSDEALEKEVDKKLKMSGFILEDPAVIRGMEANAEGRYLPVALKNGTPARTEYVADEKQFSAVMDHIKYLIAEMSSTLRSGNVAAIPLKGEHDACEWCPYSSVCGHENQDQEREETHCSKEDFFCKIEEEGKGESKNERT